MKITDYPMACCGMVEASNIKVSLKLTEDGKTVAATTNADWNNLFNKIEEHQIKWNRNCAIITLSSEQGPAISHALRNGYTKVFEFFNPNSDNQVGIYTKTLWTEEEYYRMVEEGYRRPVHVATSAEEYEIEV